jgi:hypothetical protein
MSMERDLHLHTMCVYIAQQMLLLALCWHDVIKRTSKNMNVSNLLLKERPEKGGGGGCTAEKWLVACLSPIRSDTRTRRAFYCENQTHSEKRPALLVGKKKRFRLSLSLSLSLSTCLLCYIFYMERIVYKSSLIGWWLFDLFFFFFF